MRIPHDWRMGISVPDLLPVNLAVAKERSEKQDAL
jgi:hypothetical protein